MVTSVGTDCTVVGICSTEVGVKLTESECVSCPGINGAGPEDPLTLLITGLSWAVSLDATCEAIPYKEGGLPLHSLGNQMIS